MAELYSALLRIGPTTCSSHAEAAHTDAVVSEQMGAGSAGRGREGSQRWRPTGVGEIDCMGWWRGCGEGMDGVALEH